MKRLTILATFLLCAITGMGQSKQDTIYLLESVFNSYPAINVYGVYVWSLKKDTAISKIPFLFGYKRVGSKSVRQKNTTLTY